MRALQICLRVNVWECQPWPVVSAVNAKYINAK
jgi:hypothetical protein